MMYRKRFRGKNRDEDRDVHFEEAEVVIGCNGY
jgi:hypothetical protein